MAMRRCPGGGGEGPGQGEPRGSVRPAHRQGPGSVGLAGGPDLQTQSHLGLQPVDLGATIQFTAVTISLRQVATLRPCTKQVQALRQPLGLCPGWDTDVPEAECTVGVGWTRAREERGQVTGWS